MLPSVRWTVPYIHLKFTLCVPIFGVAEVAMDGITGYRNRIHYCLKRQITLYNGKTRARIVKIKTYHI